MLLVASEKLIMPATCTQEITHRDEPIKQRLALKKEKTHAHLSSIAVSQVEGGHEVGIVFLDTCGSLCELSGLK